MARNSRKAPRKTDELRKIIENVSDVCKACNGTGGKPSNPCKPCGGSGKVRIRPL